jgi:hypothetical protein
MALPASHTPGALAEAGAGREDGYRLARPPAEVALLEAGGNRRTRVTSGLPCG